MNSVVKTSEVVRDEEPQESCSEQDMSHRKDGFFSIISSIPGGIWAISFFGLFLGMSTAIVYSQLALFLKEDLGLTVSQIANMDGLVECVAYITRVFSGPISDFFRERKLILCVGCAFTLVARSFLPFVYSFSGILGVQLSERMGNGLQASPRDALIADITPRSIRGRVYGLTKSVKTAGGLLGGVIAVTLMGYFFNDFRKVFLFAVIPVVLAGICLLFVKDSNRKNVNNNEKVEKRENPFKRKYLKSLDLSFWKLILLAFIFQLGHFSEHLFPIYMKNFVDIRVAGSTSLVVSMGQVMLAFTIGFFADKFGKGKFIRFCMLMMIVSNLLFLFAGYICNIVDFSLDLSRFFGNGFVINAQACCVYLGVFLWGGQMSAIEGLFIAIICEQVVFHLRATAIGIYSLILGGGYWVASQEAGKIWERMGCEYTFVYSLTCCVLALILSFVLLPKKYNFAVLSKGRE
ncbi:MAG: MFS transporter [Alphaproteobacteria bacterium]|nr:MFS transporter [Alphaproteobacteria bacterium]